MRFLIVLLIMSVLFFVPVSAWSEGKGVVTLTFDDAWLSQFTVAFPILSKYDFVGTVYVYTDAVEGKWPAYMSVEQLEVLKKNHWGFGSHTESHPSLSTLPVQKQEEELAGSQKILTNLNLGPIETLSFPYRCVSKETIELAGRHYRAFKANGSKKINLRPFSKFLNDFEVDKNIDLEELKNLLMEAKEKDGWLILTFHQFNNSDVLYSISAETFDKICELVKNSGLAVMTTNEVLRSEGAIK